jgi:hypothetical protein
MDFTDLCSDVPTNSVRGSKCPGFFPNHKIYIWQSVLTLYLILKGIAVPQHTYGGAKGERRYSSYSFTTSALAGGELSASRPCRALLSGKGPPVPIVQETGWTLETVWTQRLEEKSFRLCWGSNFDRPVFQSVARHCTD